MPKCAILPYRFREYQYYKCKYKNKSNNKCKKIGEGVFKWIPLNSERHYPQRKELNKPLPKLSITSTERLL